MSAPVDEPVMTVTWRLYTAVFYAVLAGITVLLLGVGAEGARVPVAIACVAMWAVLLATTATKAVLTRDELVLTTGLRRTLRIPLDRLEFRLFGRLSGAFRRRGSLWVWHFPPGRETWPLVDAIDELRGSSRGTTASGRAGGS